MIFDGVRILLIDNYDSFTYNLVQAFREQGAEVIVHRNDALPLEEARAIQPTHLVISPGPGRPENAGDSLAMIAAFTGEIPILGVCLGHQCIVQHFGGEIVRNERLMHGKTSAVHHDGHRLFEGVPEPMQAGRYHSLGAEPQSIPEVLDVSARTERGEIMAVRHRELPIVGVQFHPESVLTPEGNTLLANFMRMTPEGGVAYE